MGSSKAKKILIVENEAAQLAALKDKFSKHGYTVVTAINGEEGMQVGAAERPDLIVLDILMPVQNGLAMAKELRSSDWGKETPVMILTNSPEMEKIQEALENSVYDYFIKSDTPIESIVEKAEKLIE